MKPGLPSSEPLEVRVAGQLATVTLKRPDKLNPLDWATVKALLAGFRALDRDAGVRVVVVTGSGRAFSAGGDLEGYVELYRKPAEFRRFLDDFNALLDTIERSAKVVVAAVNGPCVAGGLELMLACDMVIASEEATIGDGHLNYGQLPGAGGSQRLPRAIGVLRAKDLIFTGRLLDGREAARIGLVTKAVPAAQLDASIEALVAELLDKSPAGLKGAKHLINEGMRGDLATGIARELDHVHDYACTNPDATEGLVAFKEKRKPMFGAD